MTYDMFRNGKCEGDCLRYKWAKLGRTWGSQASVAIDELGRLFSWGQNYWGQSGQGDRCWGGGSNYNRPDLVEIELATQLTDMKGFVKSCSGEVSSVALRANGELWGWGDMTYTDGSAFGLDPDQGVSSQQCFTGTGVPGFMDLFFRPVRCTPGYLWKDVAHDYYHTITIGMDNKLYTFGRNADSCLGVEGLGLYVPTPQLNLTLTADIKLIDTELLCSAAVTVDNKVYVWGESWWDAEANWDFSSAVPTEITGLPVGSNIVQVAVCTLGVTVLLDNGEVWTAGNSFNFLDDYTAFPDGTPTFQRIEAFASKFAKRVVFTALGNSAMHILDDTGTIWGYESTTGFTGNDEVVVHDEPNLIGVNFIGQRKYIDFISNTHQSLVWQAIDDQGFLWTWGLQNWGPHLANGTSGDGDYYEEGIVEVYYQAYPGLAAPAVDYNGNPALLNNLPEWLSEYAYQPLQLEDHNPCGYWHLRNFDTIDVWPRNCWMPSLAADDGILFFVAAGRFFPNDILFMSYDISHNIWEMLYHQEDIHSGVFPGGADKKGDVYAFANYKASVSGSLYNEVYADYALGIWTYYDGTMNYHEIADAVNRSAQSKVGVSSAGVVAVAYEDLSGNLRVVVSTDYGSTFTLRKTVTANAARKDFSLIIDSNGYIYLAHQISSSAVMIERSINNGVGWTTQKASQTVKASTVALKLDHDVAMFFLYTQSATSFSMYSSTDACVNWSSMNITVNVADGTILAAGHNNSGARESVLVTVERLMKRYGYNPVYGANDYYEVPTGQVLHTSNASIAQDGIYYGYSAFDFHLPNYPVIVLLMSKNRGMNWSVVDTPLRYYRSWEEISRGDIDPLWPFTKQEDKRWTYVL